MIGGIYLGFFTPTEGAAVGAAGTGLIATFNKKLVGNFEYLIKQTPKIILVEKVPSSSRVMFNYKKYAIET